MKNQIQFDSYLPIFLIVFVVIGVILSYDLQKKTKIPFPPLQFSTQFDLSTFFYYLVFVLDFIILLLVIVGLMNPKKKKGFDTIKQEGIDIALVLDVSASMLAEDFSPNRMEVLKKLTKEFISKNSTNRIGLYFFAGEVFTQSSLTTEVEPLVELIDSISYEMIDHSISGGTHIGDALLVAARNLKQEKIEGRDQVIILITDGESEGGIDPILTAKYIKEKEIKLFIIGIGGLKKVPVFYKGKPFITYEGKQLYTQLNDESLKEIASVAGGFYYRAIDGELLSKILKEITKLNKKPIKITEIEIYEYYSTYIAIGIFIFYLMRIFIFYFYLRSPIV